MSGPDPTVSVVICTRDRGSDVVDTLESVFANRHPAFEVIVVDQSRDQRTRDACARYCRYPNFHFLHSGLVGVSQCRNAGLRAARGNIVLCTDDDCTVPDDWLTRMESAFQVHPNIAVVFCEVKAACHDRTSGFIPEHLISTSRMVTSVGQKNSARGIGAGMAVRRDLILSLGGFDEMLGPGSAFPSCEDGDVAVRSLISDKWVYETNETSVVHHGFRTWREGKALAKRNWIGIGAAYAKPLMTGHWRILSVIAYEGICVALGGALRPILKLQPPRGLRNFMYFIHGLWLGIRVPVDKPTLKFRRRQ